MRLNPDFFNEPDPEFDKFPELEDILNSSFQVVNTLEDLPDQQKEELRVLAGRVTAMLDHELKVNPEDDAVIKYLGFQQMQIHGLQQKINQIHEMLVFIAKAIDKKEDRKDGDS